MTHAPHSHPFGGALIVARRTVLGTLRDYRLMLFGIAAMIIFAGGTAMNVFDYSEQRRQYDALRSAAHAKRNLDSVAVVRRPSRLSFMSAGHERDVPRYLVVVPGFVDTPNENVRTMPFVRAITSLDWAWVVAFLFSLAILMSTHDLVAREREDGTLRLLLAFPVRRGAVILGRYLGVLAAVLPFFVIAFLIGTAIVIISGAVDWRPDDWGRFAAFVATSLLFLAVIAAFGLLISIVFRSSSAALLCSVLGWILFAVAIPAAATALARAIAPAPPPRLVQADLENAKLKFDSGIYVNSAMLHNVLRDDSLDQNQKTARLALVQQALVEEHEDKLLGYQTYLIRKREAYLRQVEQERALAARIAQISPLVSYLSAAEAIAGSGVQNERSFRRAAHAFMRQYTSTVTPLRRQFRDSADVSGPAVEDEGYRIQGVSWVSYANIPVDPMLLPRFDGYDVTARTGLQDALGNVTMLLGWLTLFLTTGYVFFLRYDPR
jgi:ABC-type transport system involved in multi-copper enzyme maturation permease subunit